MGEHHPALKQCWNLFFYNHDFCETESLFFDTDYNPHHHYHHLAIITMVLLIIKNKIAEMTLVLLFWWTAVCQIIREDDAKTVQVFGQISPSIALMVSFSSQQEPPESKTNHNFCHPWKDSFSRHHQKSEASNTFCAFVDKLIFSKKYKKRTGSTDFRIRGWQFWRRKSHKNDVSLSIFSEFCPTLLQASPKCPSSSFQS